MALSPACSAYSPSFDGSVFEQLMPNPLGLPRVEYIGANFNFAVAHSRSYEPYRTATSFLIVPEVLLRVNRTDVSAGICVALRRDSSQSTIATGISSSIVLTRRRMVQFAVFRKESIALNYQWVPGPQPDGVGSPAIAFDTGTDKAGALAVAASTEMTVGRIALTTMLSYATPTFDPALANAAHGLPIIKPGAGEVSCTVRWHQYTSVATMSRGAVSIDLNDSTLTYMLAGGAYGSPLPNLDYHVLAGAEADINGIRPAFDLCLTYKNAFKQGSRFIFDIKQQSGTLSASLRTKWALD